MYPHIKSAVLLVFFVTAICLTSQTTNSVIGNSSTLAAQSEGAQGSSATATNDECIVRRSSHKKIVDFSKANFKPDNLLKRNPPAGVCNKACSICSDPRRGGLWCNICEVCLDAIAP